MTEQAMTGQETPQTHPDAGLEHRATRSAFLSSHSRCGDALEFRSIPIAVNSETPLLSAGTIGSFPRQTQPHPHSPSALPAGLARIGEQPTSARLKTLSEFCHCLIEYEKSSDSFSNLQTRSIF